MTIGSWNKMHQNNVPIKNKKQGGESHFDDNSYNGGEKDKEQ